MEYLNILIFLVITLVLGVILFFLSFLSVPKFINMEKNSSYECGFQPYNDSRSVFTVHFFLVALLFLIFDLETAFILPYATIAGIVSVKGLVVAFMFFLILTVGFVFELLKGAIDWTENK